MREIKFRTWDPGAKQWEMYEIISGLGGEQFCQQNTGLKDKNGKEIYEGDIVQDDDHKWVIEWCDQEVGFRPYRSFIYKQTLPPDDGPWFHACDWANFEVIGNIYENPDLLKGE